MNNPYLDEVDGKLVVTEEGKKFLTKIVTDVEGDVYAFTQDAPPLLVAAAMARLSRNPNDMRITYLNDFAQNPEKADALIKRVLTQFGDDSVQQLIGLHFVVENASNLLTKKLEWGRLAAYLEQSTRYIYFDSKINGRYRYYIPQSLGSLTYFYVNMMDKIFDTYSTMVRNLTDYVRAQTPLGGKYSKEEKQAWLGATRAQACDAVRPVLPVATTSTVGVFASAQSVESLVNHLMAEPLEEFRTVGMKILREGRKVIGPFLEKTDMADKGLAKVAYMADIRDSVKELAKKYLGHSWHTSDRAVALLNYWPVNELDLITEILFAECDWDAERLKKEVTSWNKDRKLEILQAAVGNRLNRRHKPGRAFEKIHYEWQIVGDYGTFRDLHRHRMVDMMEWQRLTIDYSFDIPNLIKDSGLKKMFADCFGLSDVLYGIMLENGFEDEAQYATLLGHKMRYRFMMNARAAFHFHELRTGPQGHPGYRKIVNEMHNELTKVHPLLGIAMRFVNKGEDPALTRMAAELATQHKLAKLGLPD